MGYSDLIAFVRDYCRRNPDASKDSVASVTASSLGLAKRGAAFVGDSYAARFSCSTGSGFSNTVCSLKTLRDLDDKPFIVVLVAGNQPQFFLANTTFLKKISHSSHALRIDNVRGSFNGTDIVREYDGLINAPENFDQLFAMHQEFTWSDNLERLVEATNNIVGRSNRFMPTESQCTAILSSPSLAATALTTDDYRRIKVELGQIVRSCSGEILRLGKSDNVNIRGNSIEQVITGEVNRHNLGDMIRQVGSTELQLEIKTKLMDRASCPKAYNVDKVLAELGTGHKIVAFCFVGIYLNAENVTASTVSIFDKTVLNATRIQFHWAGRNSRGVTQLSGNLSPLFAPTFQEQIDVPTAQQFLKRLLAL